MDGGTGGISCESAHDRVRSDLWPMAERPRKATHDPLPVPPVVARLDMKPEDAVTNIFDAPDPHWYGTWFGETAW